MWVEDSNIEDLAIPTVYSLYDQQFSHFKVFNKASITKIHYLANLIIQRFRLSKVTGKVAPTKKAAKKTRAADQGDDSSAARVKRHQASVEEQAAEKMAALYWDLNSHAMFQQNVTAGNPSPEDVSNYEIMQSLLLFDKADITRLAISPSFFRFCLLYRVFPL
ncbi:hypothetical protein N7520_007076 [Penicillium odoratum]|uniref:uncharacterized protein n=1 Tax=Penicillium odoratum TaxID=1167516 RepID=UPI0025488CBB|nr:uncharacterized protein N7520_007076 [Penicillium odoratum]KAJ5759920.1 hypothetical protein N7520_007076 [Penicillium odoratum]